jgi:polyhomeotic-like protein 1
MDYLLSPLNNVLMFSQLQQMQVLDGSAAQAQQSPHQGQNNQQASTTINTMSPLQAMQASGQMPAEWHQQGRLQVLQQQPLQNSYLQQFGYSPVVMSGNILHGGLGQQQIQLIAATGKQLQGGQLAPQMLTTAQGKHVLAGNTASGFSGSYMPAIPSSQAQTLLFSPVSVMQPQQQQQPQQNLQISGQNQTNKSSNQQDVQKQLASGQKVLQKVSTGVGGQQQQQTATAAGQQSAQQPQQQQCVQVTQNIPTAQILNSMQHQGGQQTMQFAAPWQIQQMSPFFTANGLQQQFLSPNQFQIVRSTQPDGTQGMFIQQAPQATQQTIQAAPQHNRELN